MSEAAVNTFSNSTSSQKVSFLRKTTQIFTELQKYNANIIFSY